MVERFITTEEVSDRIGLSKTHIYRLIGAGQFPRTVPVGKFRVAFVESEIDAWMTDRMLARDSGEERDRRLVRASFAGRQRNVSGDK